MPFEQVQPCSRCCGLAEVPTVASGYVGGEVRENLPLCVDRLALLVEDVEAFWLPLQGRHQGGQEDR